MNNAIARRTVWIDTAPLIASPCATGNVVEVTVLIGDPDVKDTRIYVAPHGYESALYVETCWIRPAPSKHGAQT